MIKISKKVYYLSSGTSMSPVGGGVVDLFKDTWMGVSGVGLLEEDGIRKINKRGNDDVICHIVDSEQAEFDLAVIKSIQAALPNFDDIKLKQFYTELKKLTHNENEITVRSGVWSTLGKIAADDLLLSAALSKNSIFFQQTTVGRELRAKGIAKYGEIEILPELMMHDKPFTVDYPKESDLDFEKLTDEHLPNHILANKHRILFLDVDQTLVDNESSEYNQNLIQLMCEHKFDHIYLVTGRNTNDFWQHVLQNGKKPRNWRNQLLFNIVNNLALNNIRVSGVSTPYDHYLKATQAQYKDITAGHAANVLYMSFERVVSEMTDEAITAETLRRVFSKQTGGAIYDDGLGEKAELSDALPMYLAVNNDTEKKGQFELLISSIEAENHGSLEIFFFDDKTENLTQARAVFGSNPRIVAIHTAKVDKVLSFTVPGQMIDALKNDTKPIESTSVDAIHEHKEGTLPKYTAHTQNNFNHIQISKLIKLCERYEKHLNPLSSASIENNDKYAIVQDMKAMLRSSNIDDATKISKMKEKLKNNEVILSRRRDSSSGARFLETCLYILTLGIYSKIDKGTFAFWKSHGAALVNDVNQIINKPD